MKILINGEAPFQVLTQNFSIGPADAYTLQVSADGVNYSDLFAVGADTTRMVTNVASGSYFRLKGNNREGVVVNWNKDCSGHGGGGGGTAGVSSLNGMTGDLSLKTINGNSIIGEGDIDDLATKEYVDDKISTAAEGFATKEWVEEQDYLTEHQKLKTVNNNSLVGTGNIDISAKPTVGAIAQFPDGSVSYLGDLEKAKQAIKDKSLVFRFSQAGSTEEYYYVPQYYYIPTDESVYEARYESEEFGLVLTLRVYSNFSNVYLRYNNPSVKSFGDITFIVKMTQEEYDALETKNNSWLYIIA